jgi:hypothetical protein
MKKENKNPAETLNDIHNLMERSSKFISLSGLSGVLVGMSAIIFVCLFCRHYGINPVDPDIEYWKDLQYEHNFMTLISAGGLLFFCIAIATLMTVRQSRKMGVSIWGKASKRLFINMFVPLSAGTVFCLIMFFHHMDIVLPLSLVFYGFSLYNAGKYTHDTIRSLGIMEMITGILSLAFLQYQVIFWTLGFGVLHILYGSYMYVKFDKQDA